ncbi:ABC transporter ATP-binding protein [Acanthopleuribacter pedis]|uniref:ABC transporter ATP-binding protein n=1 Tax=Acanthopleuribacter pedis TaxID=442870 RepID=A0A8J7QFT3_9BACT|nr:ABC transporter ATP-binding protein [Acanthopleuribacter pedis]MBO1317680.1 ABC transporter ATP-binding protein [Acanthopleuribacter pedis]
MLSITHLSKTYPGGVRALDGVTLDIGTGIFGLLGPNGAGKSTLMRTIAALQEPDQGSILWDGTDIVRYPHLVRQVLGYLPQDFGVYPKISAERLLDHMAVLKGLRDKKERRRQVDELLERTNLAWCRRQAVAQFSGGMRQRFGIAQALLGDPRLIIVDEPTAGLDPEERNRFHNLLGEIGENITIVLSTHIVEDVRRLCGKAAVMAGGKVLLEGRPDHLVEQLQGRVWRRSAARADLPQWRQRHRVLSDRLEAGRCFIRVLADHQPEAGFEPCPAHLEDAYFAALAAHEGEVAVCSAT